MRGEQGTEECAGVFLQSYQAEVSIPTAQRNHSVQGSGCPLLVTPAAAVATAPTSKMCKRPLPMMPKF